MGSRPTGYGRYITITPASAAANVCNVLFQVVDAEGNAVSETFHMDVYLSDSAVGDGLTSTSASGTTAAVSTYGTVLVAMTAKKALRVQTNASGQFKLAITDTSKTAFYPCATIPGGPNNGRVVVGDALETTDYGS
jgi:hypothetical protein